MNLRNLSTFKLSAENLVEFRNILEAYRDECETPWSDEEVVDMAKALISFALTVIEISHQQHQRRSTPVFPEECRF